MYLMYDEVKIRVLCGDACGVVVEFVKGGSEPSGV